MTLTTDQLRDLCRRRDADVVAAAAAAQPAAAAFLTGAKPEDLQALIKDGAKARNTLVEANTGLIHTVAGRNIHGSRDDEDYLQEGMTAAVPYIRGAVLNLLNARGGKSDLNTHPGSGRHMAKLVHHRAQQHQHRKQRATRPPQPGSAGRQSRRTDNAHSDHGQGQHPPAPLERNDRPACPPTLGGVWCLTLFREPIASL